MPGGMVCILHTIPPGIDAVFPYIIFDFVVFARQTQRCIPSFSPDRTLTFEAPPDKILRNRNNLLKGVTFSMVPLKKSVARDIGKLNNKLRRKLDTLSSRGVFSGAQGRLLYFILAQNDQDVFQRDIEETYDLRPSTVSALLRLMEQNDLIYREVSPNDGRCKRIIPTEKARDLHDQVVAELAELEGVLTQGVSPQQLDTFFQVTEIMLENLSKPYFAPEDDDQEMSAQ